MITKVCKECKIEKTLEEFHKMKGCLHGVRTVCKECRKIEKLTYHSQEHVKQRVKENYQKNKESFRKRMALHYWSLNGQYHEVKKRALKMNKGFDLTQKDCEEFYKTPCYYCGDIIPALGIDRLDSNKGYVKGNVVPCCPTCNFMKHILSVEQFYTHIKKILSHENNTKRHKEKGKGSSACSPL